MKCQCCYMQSTQNISQRIELQDAISLGSNILSGIFVGMSNKEFAVFF